MSTSITFTGDICFSHYFRDCEKNRSIISEDIKNFITNSDYCVGNIEGPIYNPDHDEDKEFLHRSNETVKDFLKATGINIWNLANNHILDYMDVGITSTINHCNNVGATWIGINKHNVIPFIIPHEGGIGIVSVTYSEAKMKSYKGEYKYIDWDDVELIRKTIVLVKNSCKRCILIVHGGEEFSSIPMPLTREKYLKFLDYGADIVIGHHPHVVQNYEQLGDKLIFYSLGNFIFDTDYERVHKHTDKGLLLKLFFDKETIKWNYLTVRIDRLNHCVETCESVPNFVEIDQNEYVNILPFAARALSLAEKKTLRYLDPAKYKNARLLNWIIRDLRLYRHKKNRAYIIEKYKSYIMKVPESELLQYILE